MALLLTAETRKAIAGTITYINVLSTCVTIVFSWVLGTARNTQLYAQMGIFKRWCPCLFLYSIFFSQKT